MADLETPRFPEGISRGSAFGPAYSTRVGRNLGGKTARNRNWTYPLHEGDVSHGVKSQAQLNELLAFFHRVAGQYDAWRFKNWADYQALVAGTDGVLVELTANTTWQMYHRHTSGAATGDHIVQKPIAATVAIAGGGSYSLDAATGIITRNSGANPTGWTGEFDFRCIFSTDKMLPSWADFGIYDWGPVPIREDRL